MRSPGLLIYSLCYKRAKGRLTNSIQSTLDRQHLWIPFLEKIKLASIYITSRKIAMSWITTVWLIGSLLFRRCQPKVTSLRCRLRCRKPWRPEATELSLLLMVIPCCEWRKVRRKYGRCRGTKTRHDYLAMRWAMSYLKYYLSINIQHGKAFSLLEICRWHSCQ